MPNNALVIDVLELFQKTFGSKPYVVPGLTTQQPDATDLYKISDRIIKQEETYAMNGGLLKKMFRGIEIMLPVNFLDGGNVIMEIPFCVLGISGSKTIVETPLAERRGTVKEQYNIDDYVINIRGFLMNEERTFPEEQIQLFKELSETSRAVTIDNVITNIFLTEKGIKRDELRRVVIYKFDLPEVQGGRESVRPFTMMLKSDTVFTLELEEV